jgi:SAM-dependent methyltransferase
MKRMPISRAAKHWLIDRWFTEALDRSIPFIQGVVLDVGCGRRPYEAAIMRSAAKYIGVDFDPAAADVVADVRALPFADRSVDTVTCFQVLDDVPEPSQLVAELARVLRPGGVLILSVNQSWREHNAPHDYFRFTRFGLTYLFQKAGLAVERIDPMGGLWGMLATRLAFWLEESLVRKWLFRPFARAAIACALTAGGILDRKNFHPEDTQNLFAVARKGSKSAEC